MKNSHRLFAPVVGTCLMLTFASPAQSGEAYELTPRLNIVGATGNPTNDMLGVGVAIHRAISNDWYLGVNLDYVPSFDFERTAKAVGIAQDPTLDVIDAVGTMLLVTVVAERRFKLGSDNWTGYWNAGGGFAEVNMDDVQGPRQDSGTFDIETSIDTELLLVANIGLMQRINENWSARYEAGFEHHMGGWDVRDKPSGSTGTVDDYTAHGVRLGITYQF